jgi:hypothetical protein
MTFAKIGYLIVEATSSGLYSTEPFYGLWQLGEKRKKGGEEEQNEPGALESLRHSHLDLVYGHSMRVLLFLTYRQAANSSAVASTAGWAFSC